MTTHLDDLVTKIKAAKNDTMIKRLVADIIQDSHMNGYDQAYEIQNEAFEVAGPWMKPNPYPEE